MIPLPKAGDAVSHRFNHAAEFVAQNDWVIVGAVIGNSGDVGAAQTTGRDADLHVPGLHFRVGKGLVPQIVVTV